MNQFGFGNQLTPKRYLGSLCLEHNHEFKNTGKSLRYLNGNRCCHCGYLQLKKRQIENPKYFREAVKRFIKRNPEKYKKQNNKYKKNRLRTDPAYRIHKKISNGLRQELIKGDKKGISWLRWAGYTAQELRIHLESQFTKNMSWDNYGTYWVIDHIIPRKIFKYVLYDSIEFRMCWALPNLQPMERHENEVAKRGRLDYYSKEFMEQKLIEIGNFIIGIK